MPSPSPVARVISVRVNGWTQHASLLAASSVHVGGRLIIVRALTSPSPTAPFSSAGVVSTTR
eukprot:9007728-Lingulodinium_polyedra.AAC.1